MDNNLNAYPNEPKSYGAVVASIIIILILIVGGLYFWGKTLEEKKTVTPVVTQEATATPAEGDSVDSLQTDINANSKNLNSVDAGLKAI